MSRILITGAAGTIGTQVARHLSKEHSLTLVDVSFNHFPADLKENITFIESDLTIQNNWSGLLDDIEYVIQLAADSSPQATFYDSLLDLNIKLPFNLFDEATRAPSLKRILFASSIHAVDAYPEEREIRVEDPVRPNDLYGVSKTYLEGLASYYAYIKGIHSIGMRIGDYKVSAAEIPNRPGPHGLSTYLSANDFNHFIECCLSTPLKMDEPYMLLNVLSNNTFTRLDLESARKKIGYSPKDNAFEIHSF